MDKTFTSMIIDQLQALQKSYDQLNLENKDLKKRCQMLLDNSSPEKLSDVTDKLREELELKEREILDLKHQIVDLKIENMGLKSQLEDIKFDYDDGR